MSSEDFVATRSVRRPDATALDRSRQAVRRSSQSRQAADRANVAAKSHFLCDRCAGYRSAQKICKCSMFSFVSNATRCQLGRERTRTSCDTMLKRSTLICAACVAATAAVLAFGGGPARADSSTVVGVLGCAINGGSTTVPAGDVQRSALPPRRRTRPLPVRLPVARIRERCERTRRHAV